MRCFARYCEKLRGLRLLYCRRRNRNVIHGKAVLFVADKTVPEGMDIQATWSPYVDTLEEHHFDFAHEDILSPEALVVLGPVFNQLVSVL